MDRKTKHDYNKTILMLERMGLKAAAQKLEESRYGGRRPVAPEEVEAAKQFLSKYEKYPGGDRKGGSIHPYEKGYADALEAGHSERALQMALLGLRESEEELEGKQLANEAELKNPEKADLDDDGKLSDYEKKRGAAVEKSMSQNEEKGIFAPNHYCVHHGGVQHNGTIAMAEAVGHNWNEELGRVTHYDMKLEDGTILEGVAFEDIQVTNASLANEHMHDMGVHADDEEEDQNENTETTKTTLPGISEEMLREAIRNVIARMKNKK